MILKTKEEQLKFKSPVCGYLIDIVKDKDFGIVKAENIKITGKHYHKKTTEAYYLISGNIDIEIKEKDKKEKLVELKAGDVLVVQPFDIHKIVKVSNKNVLFIICVPDFRQSDEFCVD